MLNTIARAGKVLNLFTPETPEWGVTEVAAALGLAKSTTYDLVSSLAEIGLLQRTSDDRYQLGWRLLVMSRRLINSTSLSGQTQRAVADLAQQLNAAVTMGAWDGRRVVCISHASSSRTGPVLAPGARLPGHASALGKLLMAQLPWARVQDRIDQYGLPALTSGSVSDVGAFRQQLADARRNDVAVEHGETVAGHSCVAVPIYDDEYRVVAALSISTPTERMRLRQDEFARIARRTARNLIVQGIAPHMREPTQRRRLI